MMEETLMAKTSNELHSSPKYVLGDKIGEDKGRRTRITHEIGKYYMNVLV
jgi:hypothetical protein